MIKSKFLRIVLFLAVLCTAVFFFCFFYLKYKETILIKLGIETKQSSSSAPTSVFGVLVGGSNSNSNILNDESYAGIKDITDFISQVGEHKSQTTSGSEASPYVWDYKTSFMRAFITGKDLTKGTLTLWISVPDDKPFSKIEKEVKVNCTSNVSALILPMNMEIIETNVNVLEKARPGVDGIMAFCLDENCDLIGRNCAIIQDLYNFLNSGQ